MKLSQHSEKEQNLGLISTVNLVLHSVSALNQETKHLTVDLFLREAFMLLYFSFSFLSWRSWLTD